MLYQRKTKNLRLLSPPAADKAGAAASVVEAIEEDDEFEEFAANNWEAGDEGLEDAKQWQDNWDDDDIEDNFTTQLRQELVKSGAMAPTGAVPGTAASGAGAAPLTQGGAGAAKK